MIAASRLPAFPDRAPGSGFIWLKISSGGLGVENPQALPLQAMDNA